MQFTRTLLAATVSAALALSLSACNHSGSAGQSGNTAATATSTTANTMASTASTASAMPAYGSTAATTPASSSPVARMVANNMQAGNNWFGGPVYNGKPDLAATAALLKAGGGAEDFDFSRALVAMLGKDAVDKEVARLTKRYGKQAVNDYVNGMTFVVKDGLKQATEQGIKLPDAPADLTGTRLTTAVVEAGTAPGGTFWSGYLFDHMISHALHNKVMADVDARFGQSFDGNTHKIDNQAMYDVAQTLGRKDVKLAPFH